MSSPSETGQNGLEEERSPGLTRSAEPVARVWRNPLPALALDRGVTPCPPMDDCR